MSRYRYRLLTCWARKFTLTLIVIALLLPLLWWQQQRQLAAITQYESLHLESNERAIKSLFTERFSDIRVLAKLPAIGYFLKRAEAAERERIVPQFQALCQAYGQYDQIRLIGRTGQELIRVNRIGDQCVDIPATDLQNKHDRYYFQETLKLAAGRIFVSPLDLNVEHGQIEQPWKPMIRYATPIVDRSGEVQAVLVLNYLAANLLDNLFEHHAGTLNDFKMQRYDYLLNSQGYYLKSGEHSQHEFAFMFDNPQVNFASDYPTVWQAIQQGARQVQNDAGLFLIRVLDVPLSPLTITYRDAPPTPHWARWYLIHRVEPIALRDHALLQGHGLWLTPTLLLLSIMAVTLLLAKHRIHREQREFSDQEIDKQNAVEQQRQLSHTMIERANECFYHVDLDAGIRMIDVNEATCRHFGTSREIILNWRLPDWDPNFTMDDVPALVAEIKQQQQLMIESRHLVNGGNTLRPVVVSINYYVDQGRHYAFGWFRPT